MGTTLAGGRGSVYPTGDATSSSRRWSERGRNVRRRGRNGGTLYNVRTTTPRRLVWPKKKRLRETNAKVEAEMADQATKRCFVISPIGAEGSEVREHADDV